MFKRFFGIKASYTRIDYLLLGIFAPFSLYIIISSAITLSMLGTNAWDFIIKFSAKLIQDPGILYNFFDTISVVINENEYGLQVENLNLVYYAQIATVILLIYLLFVAIIKRFRHIHGKFKIAYFIVFLIVSLIPYVKYASLLFLLFMPGKEIKPVEPASINQE